MAINSITEAENNIGKLYTTNGNNAWRLISCCTDPTATLENIETGKRINYAIGCIELQGFEKLIPQHQIKTGKKDRDNESPID